ncbi:tripartite ATP-independent transporter solute receptor, DctP family [Gracilibacillus ureilyticus]|uniref:Tripartite ATP-independent transporter solute receptor, DctP family n=1 Tax=Gracilibacillus ureilyticus TaxID=531814 RepID=A0A1H9SWJ3_9BACI|nr:TRAP transporter substrate-binding protein DctP [Gracilibacillus ureilyticus]SER89258.1 tripartite ATP-independent transporter solute receptor, DctP family [Gracilibacillus ureilyticus]
MIIFNKKYLLMLISILTLSFLLVACGGGDSEEGTGGNEGEDTGSEENNENTEGEEGGEEASGDFEEAEWSFVTEELDGEVQYEYAEEFGKRIEEKTGGAITVVPYEYGALGSEVDQAQLLQQGGVQLAVMSPGFTGGQVPDGQIFSLHYFFPADPAQTQEVLTNSEALNTDLRAKYEEHNITPLSYWTEGAMAWTSNVGIDEPSDWEGLNMRVQESPLMRETYAAYGATVQSISWGELYTALDRETVDAQENPVFFINSASFYEVQDTLTISNHNNYVAMTTANTDWYNGLPENEKQLIDETVAEMQDWIFEEQKAQNEAGLAAIKEDIENPTEIIELTEEQIAAFKEVAEPVHEQFRNGELTEGVDSAIYDKLKEEIAEVTGE